MLTSSEKLFRTAAGMYEKCYQIVQNMPSSVDGDIDSVRLFTLNNRAHVAYMTKDYATATVNLEKVLLMSKQLLHSGVTVSRRTMATVNEIIINCLVSASAQPNIAPSA
jgi:hypothetical protein